MTTVMHMGNHPRLISTAELAERWGHSRKTTWKWAHQGRIPGAFQTLGGNYRIPLEYVELVESGKAQTPAEVAA